MGGVGRGTWNPPTLQAGRPRVETSPKPTPHGMRLTSPGAGLLCPPLSLLSACCSGTAGCELNAPEMLLTLHCGRFSALKHSGGLICFLK